MSGSGGGRGRGQISGQGRGRGRGQSNGEGRGRGRGQNSGEGRGRSRGQSNCEGRGRGREADQIIGYVMANITSGMATLSIESPASAAASLAHERDLNQSLKERVSRLSLSRSDIDENAKLVNKLMQDILQNLKENSPRSFSWEEIGSGSYYDKTKISKPDEFDCMFTCTIRAEPISKTDAKHYCSLKLPTSGELWQPQDVVTHSDNGQFVCPKAFMTWFRNIVSTRVRDIRTTAYWRKHNVVVKHRSDSSPALTLELDKISVDVVPAVSLMEWWPKSAARWHSEWLGRKSADVAKLPVFLVAKIIGEEASKPDNHCRWWRTSFSAVEKEIILRADGAHRDWPDPTCRKDLLRLLKNDLETYKKRSGKKDPSSYHIKTLFLHYLDSCPKDECWPVSRLRERYVEAVRMLTSKYLETKRMPHYFIKTVDLFADIGMTSSDWREIIKYFKDILEKYE